MVIRLVPPVLPFVDVIQLEVRIDLEFFEPWVLCWCFADFLRLLLFLHESFVKMESCAHEDFGVVNQLVSDHSSHAFLDQDFVLHELVDSRPEPL